MARAPSDPWSIAVPEPGDVWPSGQEVRPGTADDADAVAQWRSETVAVNGALEQAVEALEQAFAKLGQGRHVTPSLGLELTQDVDHRPSANSVAGGVRIVQQSRKWYTCLRCGPMRRRPNQPIPVLEHWLDQKFCRRWIEAQRNGGDLWRQRLIAPVVMRMCSAVAGSAKDAFDFSAFSALRSKTPVSKLSGVRVVDLGSGEGWLGRLVGDAGADYFGVDLSLHLVRAAARQPRLHASQFNLERCQKDALPWDALGGTPNAKTLISCVLVLDHLSDAAVEGLLGQLADKLAKLAFDVTVMIVTLNFGLYGNVAPEGGGDGPWQKRGIEIECIKVEVPAYVRPREWYERRFRDAGFFVRACEPLHFGKQQSDTDDRPVGHRGLARLPTFWYWRLSARRQLVEITPVLRCQLQEVLAGAPETILKAFSPDGDDGKVRFYRLAAGQHVVHADNIGGELMVIVEGHVDVAGSTVHRDDQLSFGRGTLLGELEAGTAGDESHYHADALASAEGCVIAVLAKSHVDGLLQTHDGELGTVLYRNLRDKLRLALWRRHTSKPPGKWSKFPGSTPSRLGKHNSPAPYDVWRAARVLLWRAAIERLSRNRRGLDDVAFLNQTRTKMQFPGTTASGIGRAFHLFREARLVDLYFGRDLLMKDDNTNVKEAINRGWIEVVTAATESSRSWCRSSGPTFRVRSVCSSSVRRNCGISKERRPTSRRETKNMRRSALWTSSVHPGPPSVWTTFSPS